MHVKSSIQIQNLKLVNWCEINCWPQFHLKIQIHLAFCCWIHKIILFLYQKGMLSSLVCLTHAKFNLALWFETFKKFYEYIWNVKKGIKSIVSLIVSGYLRLRNVLSFSFHLLASLHKPLWSTLNPGCHIWIMAPTVASKMMNASLHLLIFQVLLYFTIVHQWSALKHESLSH